MPDVILGIDYAWSHPDPAAIKEAGYVAVGRYISNDESKDIDAAERDALFAQGLGIWFVFESTANRPLSGAAGGSVDGAKTRLRLDALGAPSQLPVFFALDQDPAGSGAWQSVVTAYRDAFLAAANPLPVALPYGGLDLIEFFKSGWQTQAWSQRNGINIVSQYAKLYQRVGRTRQLAGDYDENVIIDSTVVWWPGTVSVIPVGVRPVGTLAPLVLVVGNAGDAVAAMQALLNARGFGPLVEDGSFGGKTEAAVEAAQRAYGLTVDGQYGPKTRGALQGGPASVFNGAATLAVDGVFGSQTITRLQSEIGANPDEVFGPDTKRKLQAWVGASQDGVVGPETIRALQRKIGTVVDGIWGTGTTHALQSYLNSH